MDITLAKRRIEYLLFIVLTFVPFFINPNYIAGEYYELAYGPRMYGLTALTMIFLLILLQNRKSLNSLVRPDPINLNLLVYFLLLVISLFFALSFYLAFYGGFRYEGFTTLMIYFLLFLAARTVQISNKTFITGIMVSATILSVYGILQFFRVDPIITCIQGRAFSTFRNPNFFGSYLVLVIPILIHRFIKCRENTAGFVYGILLFALLCTLTRGTWIGTMISICVYLIINRWFSPNYKQDLLRVISFLLITVIVIYSFNTLTNNAFIERFFSVTNDAEKMISSGDEEAGSGRIFIWKRVIILIKERPLTGYGIENLIVPFTVRFGQESLARHKVLFDKAHNEYLNIAVSTGIPSLIVYLFFISQILYRSLKKLSQNESYFPFVAAVIGYLAQAIFSISVVLVAYIFWIFLGLISSYDYKQLEITEPQSCHDGDIALTSE